MEAADVLRDCDGREAGEIGTLDEDEVEFDFGLDLTGPGPRLLLDLVEVEPLIEDTMSRGLPLGIPPFALAMARAT